MSSSRLGRLPPYPLHDVSEIRARLAAEGRDVLDLGAGDSGLPVPEIAVETLRGAAGDPAYQGYVTLPGGRYTELAARLERFGALEQSA